MTRTLLHRLGVTSPIIQAPMAGVSTPELAAAVSNAGGLGSIAVGATDAAGAQKMIEDVRARTSRAFNVNVFVHPKPTPDAACEAAWLQALRPLFEEFRTTPPTALATIYESFLDDHAMAAMLIDRSRAGGQLPLRASAFRAHGPPQGGRLRAARDRNQPGRG